MKKNDCKIEILIVLFLFVLVNFLSQKFQPPITVNSGQGFDGVIYTKVAEQFSNHKIPDAEGPYVYRIGTPFLASLVSEENLISGFKIINVIGNLLATILFIFWLRLYLDNLKTRILLSALFLFMWHGPTRFVYYYPVYTDPWLFVALLAGLIGIRKVQENTTLLRIVLLGIIVFIGVLFREVSLIIAVAFLFSKNPFTSMLGKHSLQISLFVKHFIKNIPLSFFIPLFLGIVSFTMIKLSVTQNNTYSFFMSALNWVQLKTFISYLLAWFVAFGPIIIIPIYYWRTVLQFLIRNQFMLIFLFGISVLGWAGGTDTERLLFWSCPIVYLLIGKIILDNGLFNKQNSMGLFVLFVTQSLSERIFWIIPDFPNGTPVPFPILTILSNDFQYLELFSYHASSTTRTISFVEYIVLSIMLLWWLNRRAKTT